MKRDYRGLLVLIFSVTLLAACGSQLAERNNAGNQRYYAENYDAALRNYYAAQVNAPDHPVAYFNAAAALAGSGELSRAVAALEQALETADDDLAMQAYYNLGNVLYGLGQINEAIVAYQQALLIDPDDADTRYNLEVALLSYIPPTPTAQEQQTEPETDETDPETTPTNQPGGFDGPTPTPPPQDFDLSATPETGPGEEGEQDSATPTPRPDGDLTVEQAERLLEQIRQEQEALSEYLEQEASSGESVEKDW